MTLVCAHLFLFINPLDFLVNEHFIFHIKGEA